MKIIREQINIWFAGGRTLTHQPLLIDGLSIHRRNWGGENGVEYWVDFREDAKGVVPENATLLNPYGHEFGWLTFKTCMEAYRYLRGEK
jgi:hypothetical protein